MERLPSLRRPALAAPPPSRLQHVVNTEVSRKPTRLWRELKLRRTGA